jgi:apolipoprotein N-acyltransferase
VLLAIFGAARLAVTPTSYVDGVRLRVVQPNLPQDQKFNYAQRHQIMSRYFELSDRSAGSQTGGLRDVTHLIWPESAFPFFLTREPDVLARIADLLRPATVLISGGIRPPETGSNGPVRRAYNSIYVIGPDGSILSIYDKVHLVPFGEYLPFQRALERLGVMQLTRIRGGFIAGDRRRNQPVPGAPAFLPLVCYEVVFPGNLVPRGERPGLIYDHLGRYIGWPVAAGTGERPGWLLNLTNDAWFGRSPGPYQHLQQARIRAIEEGLPMVRAANNGISAVIDPLGRVTRSLPLGTQGVIDASLPQSLPPPLYARIGDSLFAALMSIAFILIMGSRRH